MAIRCIPTTKEVEELARKLQGETVASVKALIALWQEKNNKDIDTFPTSKELNDFRAKQRGLTSSTLNIEVQEFPNSGYPARTRANAEWSDITLALAENFNTAGEKLTKKAAGDKYVNTTLPSYNEASGNANIIADDIYKQLQSKGKLTDVKLNVAGNGIYSLRESQEYYDSLLTDILSELQKKGVTFSEVRSGGQTGIDEAGIKAAMNLGIKATIVAPKGFIFRDKSGKDISDRDAFMSRFTTQSEESINDESTKSFREDLAKVSQTFTPIERKNRVNLITRLFSNKVTSALEIMKSNLNKRIEAATSYEQQRELIDDMTKLTRPQVIRRLGPSNIFKKVRQTFSVYTEATQEERVELELANINADPKAARLSDEQKLKAAQMKADRQYKSFMKILDNFQVLAEEASANFSLTEGVVMDIRNDYNLDEDTNTDAVDEEGNSIDDNAENKEENYKDGWMTNVREVASYSSLSNRVRNIIRQIPRLNRRGTYDYDDLGYEQYLEPSYVHSELIQGLRDMVDARDMIPMLNKLASRKPWARQILQKVESDNQVFTAFYRAYRKDYLSYWIQKRKAIGDGSFKTETMSINKAEGTAHYFDEWRDNYEFGNILDSDSLYDKNGDIHLSKAKTGLELVNNILSQFSRVDREDEIRLSNDTKVNDDLMKALNMLGISIGKQTLQESLNYAIDNTSYPVAIRQVLEALRTIYYDLNKGNDKVTDGQPADLVNIYGSQFNSIAEVFNFVDEDTVESSVRQGDKTRYAHVNPSYLTTLLKKLRREGFEEFIDAEYGAVDWFNKNGVWRNQWIEDIRNDQRVRDKLDHMVLLEFNRKEYSRWSALDATLALFNQYFAEPSKEDTGFAWYQVPMLSDSQSAEFIRQKRYIADYENVISDKMITLVKQELDRIALVKKRAESGVDEIGNFDITKKSKGGAEFKFFPELNTMKFDGLSFEEALANIKNNATLEEVNQFIKNTVTSIMNDRFNLAVENWRKIGVFDRVSDAKDAKFVNFNRYSEDGVISDLKEWYWNSTYAQSQMIQMLTTDLAYYKDLEDFQKRNKQVHAPSERLNTLATWNGNPVLARDANGEPRKERTIYLKDDEHKSLSFEDIKEVVDAKVTKGELTNYDRAVILGKYEKVNVADAQAYRSLDSFRATQIMADMWSQEEEDAYNNFKDNKWSARDFTVLWNTRKPYLYTQSNQSNQVDEGQIRVPTQNKNSEMILLTQAIFGEILASPKMKAMSDFMKKYEIDVIQFESTVKDGKQGVIDINGVESYEEVMGVLEQSTGVASGMANPNYVHEFDYNDYGIQTATPEHGIDKEQLVGTQIRRLIGADIADDAILTYGKKSMTKAQWFDYFNAVNVANIREKFEEVQKIFGSPKEVEKILQSEVRNNPRYGTDLLEALSLNEQGEFTIPLDDPSQALRIQSLLNSVIKSRITKQKIKGGALIQASAYGLARKPQMVFEGEGENKRLKYMECYLPCPSEKLYDLLLDPNTHELDINKKDENGKFIVPEKLREVIGYRVPTEDKYSMAPLRVIGFLPRQVGSVIILPEDITTIAGSDFDVDKMYVMFHDFYLEDFDRARARKDFEKANAGTANLINQMLGLEEDIEENDVYKEWFKENQEMYRHDTPKVVPYKYNYNKVSGDSKMDIYNNAKANNKPQRDSQMIDLMWSVLTNSDTAGKFLNPGGFDEQKRTARLATILQNNTLDQLKSKYGGVDKLINYSLDELDNIVRESKQVLNPLTPDTWVNLHQRNMSGASLIGIAANHNASHALMQSTQLGIAPEYVLTINGHQYNSFHDIKNAEGKFITRNVSGFLAAFVDNAKDPIAGDMNFNMVTADLAFTLLRMGHSPMTTGLIISQPIVREITEMIENTRRGMTDVINEVLEKYKKLAGGENINTRDKINSHNFTDSELASNIAAANNPSGNSSNIEEAQFFGNQLMVGYMFSKLSKLSTALGDLTQATRADTQNGAAGPSIAANVVKIERVDDLLNKSQEEGYPLTGIDFIGFGMDENAIINSPTPILQAMFTYGIEGTEDMFKPYVPYYTDNYNKAIAMLKDVTKFGRLDEKTRNSIYNDILTYYMSQYSQFGADDTRTAQEKRDYFINQFPQEFAKFKEAHPELSKLSFINRLKVIGRTKYKPVPSIVFTNVGKITPMQKEQYIRDWTTLLYMNEETSQMAKDLFTYNYFKGFGFSPSGFGHLTSTQVKLNSRDYIRSLREVMTNPIDVNNFWRQYVRNHMDNRSLVPDVSKSSIEVGVDTEGFNIKLDKYSSFDDKQLAKPFDPSTDKEFTYHEYVYFNVKGRDMYFQLINVDAGTAEYSRIKPLGLKNQYVEYQYGMDASAMESVVSSAEPSTSFNDIYDDYTPVEDTRDVRDVPHPTSDVARVLGYEVSEDMINELANLTPNDFDPASGESFCL